MNGSEMARKIAEKTGLTKAKAQEVVSAIFDASDGILAGAMAGHAKVVLPGFGTFATTQLAARSYRSPQDGAVIQKPARRAIRFKPGKTLRDRIGKE